MEVRRGKPEVLGPDPEAPELLLIDVPLEPQPDEVWADIFGGRSFLDGPPGAPMSEGMHLPDLRGASVRLRAPDAEVEAYLAHLDARITATNAALARRVQPEIERQERDRLDREGATRRRDEDARRKLDGLS
jgi:hypothetical protein